MTSTTKLLLAATAQKAPGNVYFVTDDDAVNLWDFLQRVNADLGVPPIQRNVPYCLAYAMGAAQEWAWNSFDLAGEPTITRYAAAELAKHS